MIDHQFEQVVDTEDQFRETLGHPSRRVASKVISRIDEHCRAFIGKSPFILVATSDAEGRFDVSPKGDPPGFVHVLDETTLAIPDRPGNRRADTFSNIIQNPRVGLIFLVPGKTETLRVNGSAKIVGDDWLRKRMATNAKVPDFALVVNVEEALFHCSKCMIRSKLWDPAAWPDPEGLPSLAETMVDHSQLSISVDEMDEAIQKDAKERLY